MAEKKAVNALSIVNINKNVKKLNAQSTVKVYSSTTDDYFTFKIDEKLKKTKIMAMISEVMAQIQYARVHKINLEDTFMPFSILMMIKHFTSLGKDIPDNLNDQLAVMFKLIDLDLLQPILEQFPEEESERLFDVINQAIEDTDQRVRDITERMVDLQHSIDEGSLDDIFGIGEYDVLEVEEEVEGVTEELQVEDEVE